MKTAWYIAKKDLLQAFTDRNSIIFMVLMPIILISVIGLALGNIFNGDSGPFTATVAISNQDSGYVGKTIVDALNINNKQLHIILKQSSNPDDVTNEVADSKSDVDAGIVIPAGTTDALTNAVKNGEPTNNLIKFYTLPGNNDPHPQVVQNLVTSVVDGLVSAQYASAAAVGQVNSVCHQPENHCEPATIDPQKISEVISQAHQTASNSTPIQTLTAGSVVEVNTFDQYVPGYAIFFALFSINAVAGTILQEKEDGTFRRLLIAPIQKYSLLAGKVLAQFVLTTLQLAVLFLFGYLFFHIHINNLPAILLLVLGTSFGATGLGIILVSLVKTRRQLNPLVTLVTLVSSAIGGIWWPLWLEPEWLQQISKIGLPSWAMEGLNNVMIYGKDLGYILPDVLGLFAYGLICYIIGLRLFRFQERAA